MRGTARRAACGKRERAAARAHGGGRIAKAPCALCVLHSCADAHRPQPASQSQLQPAGHRPCRCRCRCARAARRPVHRAALPGQPCCRSSSLHTAPAHALACCCRLVHGGVMSRPRCWAARRGRPIRAQAQGGMGWDAHACTCAMADGASKARTARAQQRSSPAGGLQRRAEVFARSRVALHPHSLGLHALAATPAQGRALYSAQTVYQIRAAGRRLREVHKRRPVRLLAGACRAGAHRRPLALGLRHEGSQREEELRTRRSAMLRSGPPPHTHLLGNGLHVKLMLRVVLRDELRAGTVG